MENFNSFQVEHWVKLWDRFDTGDNAARDFHPRVNFQCTLPWCLYSYHEQSHTLTSAVSLNCYASTLILVHYAFSDTCTLKIQWHKHKTHGLHTFSYFGPHICNSLTQDLGQCLTIPSFKTKLKTILKPQQNSQFPQQCSVCVCACTCVCEWSEFTVLTFVVVVSNNTLCKLHL